ncbi:glycosyltransferase [Streptosporangium lutulentum]
MNTPSVPGDRHGVDAPRIPGNDYGVLNPPAIGAWEPRLPVSVVIPARQNQGKLDLTLAALAAQTYPAHLLEVIVVDDGSAPRSASPRSPPNAPASSAPRPAAGASPGPWSPVRPSRTAR